MSLKVAKLSQSRPFVNFSATPCLNRQNDLEATHVGTDRADGAGAPVSVFLAIVGSVDEGNVPGGTKFTLDVVEDCAGLVNEDRISSRNPRWMVG
jgi:hypothetical protein